MYDTGNFAHLIFNISSGRGFYHYVLQTSAWSDHFTPNLALLTPLFWIKPTILWLPIVRLIAYLACLPILWKISKFYLLDKRCQYLVLILWLTNYALLKMLSWEFHFSSIALPFLLLSFYLYLKRYYILFVLNLFFLLGFKEHMALALLSVGVWLFLFEKARKQGIFIMAGGIIAGIIIMYILTPLLSGGIDSHQLEKFGPFKLLPQKAEFIFLILLSVGFLPLLNPKTLLFILPTLGISLLSNKPSMASINNYYQDLPITIVFIAVILGLSGWERKEGWFFRISIPWQKIASFLTLSCLILYNNHYPARIIRQQWPTSEDLQTLSEINRFKKEVNPQRIIWTSGILGAYFIELPYLRLFGLLQGPFHEEKYHYLVFDAHVNNNGFKQKIEEILRSNKYDELAGYKKLHIYRSK